MTREEILELKRSTADLLDQAAADDLAEEVEQARARDRAERERLERIAMAAERTAEHTKPKLARSRMTVAQKSEFIAKRGQAAYLALPWHDR